MAMNQNLIDYLIQKISFPIREFLKWKKVNAIANAGIAAKDTQAGHRVYLRAITDLEVELGIKNDANCEVQEGYLNSVDDVRYKPKTNKIDDNSKEEQILLNEKKIQETPSDKPIDGYQLKG